MKTTPIHTFLLSAFLAAGCSKTPSEPASQTPSPGQPSAPVLCPLDGTTILQKDDLSINSPGPAPAPASQTPSEPDESSRARSRAQEPAQLTKAESAQAAQSKMIYEVTKRSLHRELATQIKSRIETGGGYAAAMAKTFTQVGLANVYKEGESSRLAFETHARGRLEERKEMGPVFGKMLAMIEEKQYPADELKGFALAAQKLDEEEDADYWSPLIEALSQNKLGTAFTMYKGHGQTDFSVKRRELIVKIEAACGPRPPQ